MYRPTGSTRISRWAVSALRCIRLAMLTAGKADVRSLLDFGCGHALVRLLRAPHRRGRAEGPFVFMTHGNWAAARMRSGDFSYGPNEDQIEELLQEYDREGFASQGCRSGMPLTSPLGSSRVQRQSQLGLVGYYPRAWGDHQDVVACVGTGGS